MNARVTKSVQALVPGEQVGEIASVQQRSKAWIPLLVVAAFLAALVVTVAGVGGVVGGALIGAAVGGVSSVAITPWIVAQVGDETIICSSTKLVVGAKAVVHRGVGIVESTETSGFTHTYAFAGGDLKVSGPNRKRMERIVGAG